jgi:hypothetical protein
MVNQPVTGLFNRLLSFYLEEPFWSNRVHGNVQI